MTREEFEKRYLGKKVKIILFDNDICIGDLHNTEEKIFENDPNFRMKTNYYTVTVSGNAINYIFRKSHIKKIDEVK